MPRLFSIAPILLAAGVSIAINAQTGTSIIASFTGPATNELPKNTREVEASGSGTLAPYGAAALSMLLTVVDTDTASAQLTLSFSSGTTLIVNSIITASDASITSNGGSIQVSGTVTGTGTFANYTGTLNYTLAVVKDGSFTITGTGTIALTQVFPHVAADTTWQTDFVFFNTSSAPVSYTLALHPDSGTTIPIAGQGAVSQISGTVAANGTQFYTTDATADSDGWAELQSSGPLNGVAVFHEATDQTSVLLSEPSTLFSVAFDSSPYTNALAIANTDSTNTAAITCQAFDESGNSLTGVLSSLSLAPLAHTAFLLPQTSTRGQLFCRSTTSVSAVELRAVGSEFSTMPVESPSAADPSESQSVQFFPHIAADTMWQTDFFILNTSTAPVNFTLTLHPDSGAGIPITGMGTETQIAGTLAANGMAFYSTDATADSDGWAELESSAPLSGVAVFQETNDQTSVLLSTSGTSFAMPFDSTAPASDPSTNYENGLAIANTDSANPATITCQAYDSTGTAIGGSLAGPTIPPLGHTAFLLQQTPPFSALPTDTRGQLVCTSTTAVSAVELRALGSQISTMPVVVSTAAEID